MSRTTERQFGFTLIEVTLTLGLLIIILVGFLSLYEGYDRVYASEQALVAIAGSARSAVGEFQTLAMQAVRVVPTIEINGTTYTTDQSTLILELPAINSSGDVIAGTFDYAVIYSSGTKAYRLMSANANSARNSGLKQLSDTVLSLTFTTTAATASEKPKAEIHIHTQTKAGRSTHTYQLRQQAYLRNS